MNWRQWLGSLAALALITFLASCGDDTSGPGGDGDLTDSSDETLQDLADSLATLTDLGSDEIQNISWPELRQAFDQALAANPGDRIAHLGSAILDLVELNYEEDLWELIDDLRDYSDTVDFDGGPIGPIGPGGSNAPPGIYLRDGSPILGNQFRLLATAPRELAFQSARAIPSSLTIANLQNLIETHVLPKLSSAIDHLTAVEANGGPVIVIEVEDETTEIDVGEVYFFHAAAHVARAGLLIATAYDFDVPGPDGTYGWIDDADALEACESWGSFELIDQSVNYRLITRSVSGLQDAAVESSMVSILHYNLEDRDDFLAQKDEGTRMQNAFADIEAARDLIADAVASIRNEGDDQIDDVIRLMDLTDLDGEIANGEPVFGENFTTIESVLDWIDELLTGPYDVSDVGDVGPVNFTINLRAFFQNAPDNWKDLLPYYAWEDPGDWIDRGPWGEWTVMVTPGDPYRAYACDGTYEERTDVAEIVQYSASADLREPFYLTNGPGGTRIDLATEKVPYFRDYSMNGLFPGADRVKWLEVFTNAGW